MVTAGIILGIVLAVALVLAVIGGLLSLIVQAFACMIADVTIGFGLWYAGLKKIFGKEDKN